MKILPLVILPLFLSHALAVAAERESEHPPLSENTKRAIADFKQRPTEENRAKLLKTMGDNYDAVIQLKKDNLAERIEKRKQNISRWMRAVRSGEVPPFLKLNTENHKGNERKAVADAIDAYRENRTDENESAVKKRHEPNAQKAVERENVGNTRGFIGSFAKNST